MRPSLGNPPSPPPCTRARAQAALGPSRRGPGPAGRPVEGVQAAGAAERAPETACRVTLLLTPAT